MYLYALCFYTGKDIGASPLSLIRW